MNYYVPIQIEVTDCQGTKAVIPNQGAAAHKGTVS